MTQIEINYLPRKTHPLNKVLTPAQGAVLDCELQEILILGGRISGKTYALNALALGYVDQANYRALMWSYIRRPGFFDVPGLNQFAKLNVSTATFGFGATVDLKWGVTSTLTGHGQRWHFIGADDGEDMTLSEYLTLAASLNPNGSILANKYKEYRRTIAITMNPQMVPDWAYERFVVNANEQRGYKLLHEINDDRF